MKNRFFRRGYEITLNKIHDTVKVTENGESLVLTVCADPMRIVSGLSRAQEKMQKLSEQDEPDVKELHESAEYFAAVIFGVEQAEKLFSFYGNDPACVINVCGQYFRERLQNKITAAQKRFKV